MRLQRSEEFARDLVSLDAAFLSSKQRGVILGLQLAITQAQSLMEVLRGEVESLLAAERENEEWVDLNPAQRAP